MSVAAKSKTVFSESPYREYIAGLEKELAVLELFNSEHPQLMPMLASSLTGLPRASARRCLRTLEKLGYLNFDGKHYGLTSRVLRLGHAYFESTQIAKVVQPVLENLAQCTNQSDAVAILDGADSVFIARATVNTSFPGAIGVGVRMSAYNTATGRMLLTSLEPTACRLDRPHSAAQADASQSSESWISPRCGGQSANPRLCDLRRRSPIGVALHRSPYLRPRRTNDRGNEPCGACNNYVSQRYARSTASSLGVGSAHAVICALRQSALNAVENSFNHC